MSNLNAIFSGIMEDDINKEYIGDKPIHLVENIDYTMCVTMVVWIKHCIKVIFIQNSNSIGEPNHTHQYM